MKMNGTLYEKVEEVRDTFYELYGKEIYTDFTLPKEVTNAYYKINDLLMAILGDLKMEEYDSAEE